MKQNSKRLESQLASQQHRVNEIQQELDRTIYSFDEQRNSELTAYDQYTKELTNKLATL
jgi:hypothetical protein